MVWPHCGRGGRNLLKLLMDYFEKEKIHPAKSLRSKKEKFIPFFSFNFDVRTISIKRRKSTIWVDKYKAFLMLTKNVGKDK